MSAESSPSDSFSDLSPETRRVIQAVRDRNLTYLSTERLDKLAELCAGNERQQRVGIIIEAGCALGGSSIVICSAKSPHRELRVYDVFGMIPSPSEQDGEDVHARYREIVSGQSEGIGGDLYYGYHRDLLGEVSGHFEALGYPLRDNGVSLIGGLLQGTLKVDEPVSLAHVDVDWYEPVRTCLERIAPRLSIGGSIVVDDYHDWSGCRKAVDEYFAHRRHAFRLDHEGASFQATRIAPD